MTFSWKLPTNGFFSIGFYGLFKWRCGYYCLAKKDNPTHIIINICFVGFWLASRILPILYINLNDAKALYFIFWEDLCAPHWMFTWCLANNHIHINLLQMDIFQTIWLPNANKIASFFHWNCYFYALLHVEPINFVEICVVSFWLALLNKRFFLVSRNAINNVWLIRFSHFILAATHFWSLIFIHENVKKNKIT